LFTLAKGASGVTFLMLVMLVVLLLVVVLLFTIVVCCTKVRGGRAIFPAKRPAYNPLRLSK
jgi:hypothetical protein